MKEFFDQKLSSDEEKINNAESKHIFLAVEKSPEGNKKITNQEELDNLMKDLFGKMNPNGRRIDLVKYDLEEQNRFLEGEIENLTKKNNPELNEEKITRYKQVLLKNSLCIKKIDDFIKDRQMKPSLN